MQKTTEQLAREAKTLFPDVQVKYDERGVAMCLGTQWWLTKASQPVEAYVDQHPDYRLAYCSGVAGAHYREMVL